MGDGEVYVTKQSRLRGKSKHRTDLLSWEHRSDAEEEAHRTFNADTAERLAQDLASGCGLKPLLAHDMPQLLVHLLVAPFRGVAPPHDYAFEEQCWGRHLCKEFIACVDHG